MYLDPFNPVVIGLVIFIIIMVVIAVTEANKTIQRDDDE